MEIFKEIDIAEPIWKTKSVGLAVDDVPMGQNVKVTISYISRNSGKRSYPGEYIVEVDKVRTYPVQNVKRMNVHIVPIADLAKLTVFNNQKANTMLFSQNELSGIIKDSEEAKKGNFENKEMITPGKHILMVKDVTLEYAKSDKNPMIVVEFELDDNHKTIKEFMKIAGPNTDIPRQKLVKLFHRGFNYEIQPCNTEADLMNQLTKFKGKKLTVVVSGQKSAYAFQDKEGKDIVMEQVYPNFWYCGTTAEFGEITFDEAKLIKDLSDEDKDKLVRFAEINGGPYIPKKSQATATPAISAPAETATPVAEKASAPQQAATVTPNPIEEVPAKAEPVQTEAPATVAPAPQTESAPAPAEAPAANTAAGETPPTTDDDFPF